MATRIRYAYYDRQGHGKVADRACATAGVMSHAGGPPALPAIIFRSGRWFEAIARTARPPPGGMSLDAAPPSVDDFAVALTMIGTALARQFHA